MSEVRPDIGALLTAHGAVNVGSMSDGLMSSPHRSPLIAVEWPHLQSVHEIEMPRTPWASARRSDDVDSGFGEHRSGKRRTSITKARMREPRIEARVNSGWSNEKNWRRK